MFLRRYLHNLSVASTCLASVACAGDRASNDLAISNHTGTRRFIQVSFDTVFATQFSEQDTVLLDPGFMEVDSSGVVMYDVPRAAVVKLDGSGKLMWTLGRSGGGPAEFRHVRDIERGPNGSIAVLDPGLGRVTILTPQGGVRAMVDVAAAGHAEQIVPLSGGRFVLGRLSSTAPFVVVDSLGVVQDSIKAPWLPFGSLNPMAAQFYLAASNTPGRWVAGLSLGSVFWIMDGMSPLVPSASYVEWNDAPEPTITKSGNAITTRVPNAPTAVDLVLADTAMFVLFRGESEHAGRLIDVYEPATGRYRYSLLLPTTSTELAYSGGAFYLMTWTPAANILGLRPKNP